jgi:hypothetical protein
MAKIAWRRRMDNNHGFCETPKHLSSSISSKWIMVAIEQSGMDPIVQGMCESCMGLIAHDLGTTPEEGQI